MPIIESREVKGLTLQVTCTGHTVSDIVTALEEAAKLIDSGCTSAPLNSSETGSFAFNLSGETVSHYRVRTREGRLTRKRYEHWGDAFDHAKGGTIVPCADSGSR